MKSYRKIENKYGDRQYVIPEFVVKGKLPSVTTICNLMEKPALHPWFQKMPIEYFQEHLLDKILSGEFKAEEFKVTDASVISQEARKYADKKKNEAGDIGTKVHEFIHNFLVVAKAGDLPTSHFAITKDMKTPVDAFMDWWREYRVIPLEVEHEVWSSLGFAGTFDFSAKIGKRNQFIHVVEVKTGKYVYDDQIFQVAAYFHAYKERGGSPQKASILRLDKESGMPEFVTLRPKQLELYFDGFLALCQLWHTKKEIKNEGKSAKGSDSQAEL